MGSNSMMMVGMMGIMCCFCFLAISSMGALVVAPKMLGGMTGDAPGGDEVPRAGDGCIYLFEDKDGQGTPFSACLDGKSEFGVADLRLSNYNDKARVLDVGTGVSVKLFEDINYNNKGQGKKTVFKTKPEWVDLEDIGFGRKASSLKLTKKN
jgi:hypothetical protein